MATTVSRPMTSYINLDKLQVAATYLPTVDDFKRQWLTLDEVDKVTTGNALRSQTYKDFAKFQRGEGDMSTSACKAKLVRPGVLLAYYYGVMAKMSSDTVRRKFIKDVLISTSKVGATTQQMEQLVLTDRGHLQELAKGLRTDGDGKREILRTLIAYGMQTKQVEPESLTASGKPIPAVYGLADPKVAHTAVIELNKMDHEYGETDKSASSIESQAERVKRLSNMVKSSGTREDRRMKQVALSVGASSKRIPLPPEVTA
jgi:hypothetical protein